MTKYDLATGEITISLAPIDETTSSGETIAITNRDSSHPESRLSNHEMSIHTDLLKNISDILIKVRLYRFSAF